MSDMELDANPGEQMSVRNEAYSSSLERKWARLLEGIENPYVRRCTAMLFENEANHLRGKKLLTEEVTTGDVGSFLRYVFPIIRRVFPNLIANNIISVQPMTAPIGGVFFFRYRYGSTKGTITTGDEAPVNFDESYSSERIEAEAIGTGTGAQLVWNVSAPWTPVRAGSYQVYVNGTLVSQDNGAGLLTAVAGSGITGAIDYTTGVVVVTCGAAPVLGALLTANYQFVSEMNPNIPQYNADISLQQITAVSRKLRVNWSAEAAEDIRALHGVELESEMVAGASNELGLELDREIIKLVRNGAIASGMTDKWNAVPPSNVSRTEHLKSIIVPISRMSNQIHRRTLRRPANWIVTSPEVCALLDACDGLFVANSETLDRFSGGVEKYGVLQNRWTVYKDPHYPANEMLIGYQGPTFMDTGAVFAPYIPLQITPTFLDPADWQMKKGFRSRYGLLMIRNEFFSRVIVDNVNL